MIATTVAAALAALAAGVAVLVATISGQQEQRDVSLVITNAIVVTMDAEGYTWVVTGRRGVRTELDLFGPGGEFLGTLTVAGKAALLAVRLPYLAVLAERTEGEDEGFQGIDLYRVGRPQ